MEIIDLLSRPNVLQATGKKRSKFQKDITLGLFTPPVKDGRSSRWPKNEVAILNAARIAGKSEGEIKALVADLVKRRHQAMQVAA